MSETDAPDLGQWVAALMHPAVGIELVVLLLCALLAWGLTRAVAAALGGRSDYPVLLGRRLFDGVLFPGLLLGSTFLGRQLLAHWMHPVALRLALSMALALLVIRVGVKVLQAAFRQTPLVRLLERSISWLAWLALVLWVTGLLPALMAELDQVRWSLGDTTLSLRKLIEGSLTAGLVLIVTLWVSAAIERRLMGGLVSARLDDGAAQGAEGASVHRPDGGELSLRLAVSNLVRAALMTIGLMLALSAVGIDLTALSVLGGAVGVGIGLGLQKLAANYVSGFVILTERSMRIGDQVLVDGFTGIITRINARYTVIRSLAGREAIVPNELMITSKVESLTLADTQVWQSTSVGVSYDADVEQVMRLLIEAALTPARVLRDPGPSAQLNEFGADGLIFSVGYWIADPQAGVNNVKSEINLAILRALRAAQIEIPYPQRVLHQARPPVA